ncbi:MAG: ATP-binding protein [Rhodocyclales bacterium CG_4_9_14_3_um_filter_68_10]|nr:MAG: ATP-binding protein [Rhodocyclales bacterium CG_4_10_14_3_um_filter_68_10]PJA57180.1 MAG: ATP-binding protein [Rhodocyclales bacterium CG_4_9_14_3_um_filter_68_10]
MRMPQEARFANPPDGRARARLARLSAMAVRHRRWVLVAMLALLHAVVVQGAASTVGRVLLIGHLGLFLLWQPLIHAETRLGWTGLAALVAGCAAVAVWAAAPVLLAWIILLAGILGGRVFFSDHLPTRLFYLLALGDLVTELLVLVTPEILPQPVDLGALRPVAHYALPTLLVAMILLPRGEETGERFDLIDLMYSAFVVLLLAVLVLGSLALMLLAGHGYFESLLLALATVAAVLLVLGWVWNPRLNFAGLGLLFSRHVLSAGVPFEDWLEGLTEAARREPDAQRFASAALAQFMALPGIRGGRWSAPGASGEFGARDGLRQVFRHGDIELELASRRALSPAFVWHVDLMVQILNEFHLAKRWGGQLEQMAYLRAVYETGARLTHDIKNLLQSLNALCFAAAREDATATPEFRQLLAHQLPEISRRLQETLARLQRPEPDLVAKQDLGEWWAGFRERYAGQGVAFVAALPLPASRIPGDLFSGVADNLIRNALDKRHAGGPAAVSVTLEHAGGIALSVADSGEPLPAALARTLFEGAVPSATGLGIGLYQSSRRARSLGWELTLAENRPGRVCFRLAPNPDLGRPEKEAAAT